MDDRVAPDDSPAKQTQRARSAFKNQSSDAVSRADDLFETLANRRRRETLRYLRDSPAAEAVSVREVSAHVAAWENEVEPAAVTYKQRKRVYTALYQSHLPKLHEHGFVEYDADRGTVRLAPRADAWSAHLDPPGGDGAPWSMMYLGTALVAYVFVSVGWLGVIPSAAAWYPLVACVAVFTALSVGHAVRTR